MHVWGFITTQHDSRKKLIDSSGAAIMAAFAQRAPPDLLVWRPAGITVANWQGCIYLHTFKKCCLRFWLRISQKLGTKWNSSPWVTNRSWHTLNNRSISRIIRWFWPSQSFKRQPRVRGRLNKRNQHLFKGTLGVAVYLICRNIESSKMRKKRTMFQAKEQDKNLRKRPWW